MADRRRIHRRDGARHWTLMRDLADPRLWVERYHLPTWLDYVRHNQRITQADIALTDHARALHRGEGRSEEHTSDLQSLMHISYAVFCLKKKTTHRQE